MLWLRLAILALFVTGGAFAVFGGPRWAFEALAIPGLALLAWGIHLYYRKR